jgi:hypothetical protein
MKQNLKIAIPSKEGRLWLSIGKVPQTPLPSSYERTHSHWRKAMLLMISIMVYSASSMAQWANDTVNGVNMWPNEFMNYGFQLGTNSNGVTYGYFHGVDDDSYPMYVQVVDQNGCKVIEGYGQELSNHPNISWTKDNQSLVIDRQGNAIIVYTDLRSGDEKETYSVYKVNPQGEVVWGDKTLKSKGELDAMSIVCTDDGYVFADENCGDGSNVVVDVEKLSLDGESLWARTFSDPKSGNLTNPYLVNTAYNQIMMVYARGANQTLMATLLDNEGNPVWDKDVVIYKDGFTDIPLWVQMSVHPGPDNGVLISWQDLDAIMDNYENRMAYVMKDGLHGFAAGEGGVVISNDSAFSRLHPEVYYDKDDNAIYALFKQMDQNDQQYEGISMQKISTSGELLWGEKGKAVIEVQDDNQYRNPQVRDAGDGNIAVFYQMMEGADSYSNPVGSFFTLFDKDGNQILQPVNFTPSETVKHDLFVSDLLEGNHYVVGWSEGFDSEYTDVNLKYLNLDGTTTDIKTIHVQSSQALKVQHKEIYSIRGERLHGLRKGVNVVRIVDADGTSKIEKVVVR